MLDFRVCLPCSVLPSSSSSTSSPPTVEASPLLLRTVEFIDEWLASPLHPPVEENDLDLLVEDYIFHLDRQCRAWEKPSPDDSSLQRLRASAALVRFCVVRGRPFLEKRSKNPSSLLEAAVQRAEQAVRRFGA